MTSEQRAAAERVAREILSLVNIPTFDYRWQEYKTLVADALLTREREARRLERRRAVAYIRVLAVNHPHAAGLYEHAAVNLEAALETEWATEPLRARAKEQGDE